ncbi:FAD binding domain-containing protein [Aspergillus cavernicola]|uniref:FAD binding domain-containing protein n=1 Tax=Aspergillus cavernicola TaxID=176166 RepID=A0ABR4HBX3_9EURO
MAGPNKKVSALIIGGGPVGLLMAYQLARSGCSSECIYSRSSELLDQLGLVDDLLQECHVCRESYTYDSEGERVVPGRVWNFVENIEGTRFDFAIMLRQQFIERCFRKHLAALGVTLAVETECMGFEVVDSSRVVSVLEDLKSGMKYTVESEYLIGADGGKSFVRRHLNIPFEGDTTQDKWIRVDGKVKTDLPTPRSYGSIESPTHGNVLWAPLDRNMTRIGYVFIPEQEARHGGKLTQEAVVQEAIAAVKPFKLEFQTVEWWTLYVIGQRVASTYQPNPRILLVGDACHTHSSGAAQGLNTGIHDATNLGWKLSLVLKGLATPSLLETYNTERRSAAQRLITFDRRISTLMANKWPVGEEPAPGETKDINQVLASVFDDAAGYNTGLGIAYEGNILNQRAGGGEDVSVSVEVGHRAPDVELLKPGTLEATRSQAVTPNEARFNVLVFVGDPRVSLRRIRLFSEFLSQNRELEAGLGRAVAADVVRMITIASVGDTSVGTLEAMEGQAPFGAVYYDTKRTAHRRYGVDLRYGALVVVRPDGYVGFVAELSEKGGRAVEEYLGGFLVV